MACGVRSSAMLDNHSHATVRSRWVNGLTGRALLRADYANHLSLECRRLALFGLHSTFNLSPVCKSKRKSSDHGLATLNLKKSRTSRKPIRGLGHSQGGPWGGG